jgi:hypothetical protein
MSNSNTAVNPQEAKQMAEHLFQEGIFKQAFAERMSMRGHNLNEHEVDQAIGLGLNLLEQEARTTKSASSSLLSRALQKVAGDSGQQAPRPAILPVELEKLAQEAVRLADDPRIYAAAMYLGE